MPAVLPDSISLGSLSPSSHTHTDSRVHEGCWLVRLSLCLHPTTYSLSLSLCLFLMFCPAFIYCTVSWKDGIMELNKWWHNKLKVKITYNRSGHWHSKHWLYITQKWLYRSLLLSLYLDNVVHLIQHLFACAFIIMWHQHWLSILCIDI